MGSILSGNLYFAMDKGLAAVTVYSLLYFTVALIALEFSFASRPIQITEESRTPWSGFVFYIGIALVAYFVSSTAVLLIAGNRLDSDHLVKHTYSILTHWRSLVFLIFKF